MTTPALPSESAMAYIAAALATCHRIGGDVGEDRRAFGTGPGSGAACQPTIGMPALAASSMPALLLDGVEAADDDAVGLERDGLAQRGGAAGDGALAVDHAHGPADGLGGFLDALGDAEHAAVLHVAGDVDDGLAGLPTFGPVVGPSHLSALRSRPWRRRPWPRSSESACGHGRAAGATHRRSPATGASSVLLVMPVRFIVGSRRSLAARAGRSRWCRVGRLDRWRCAAAARLRWA